jgi:hypothetical protein
MAENTQADVNKLTFEKALAELEQIVQKLERGDVPLEESVTIYERDRPKRGWRRSRSMPASRSVPSRST